MVIAIAVIIFIIGCCLSTYEDTSYRAQKSAEARHKELLRTLEECQKEHDELDLREERRARRHIAKDKEGNILAEEVIEEILR